MNGDRKENEVLLDRAASGLSFAKGSAPPNCPRALVGSIALLRQSCPEPAQP